MCGGDEWFLRDMTVVLPRDLFIYILHTVLRLINTMKGCFRQPLDKERYKKVETDNG